MQTTRSKILIRMGIVVIALTGAIGLKAKASEVTDSDDEESVRTVHSANAQASLKRQYAGGLDEEDLTVQAALPQPVRSPDAVAGAPDQSSSAPD